MDPIIYMTRGVESKIVTPKNPLAPIIEKYNHQNSEPITPLMSRDLVNQSNLAAMDIISEASRISPIRQNYMQQKKILQQIYGAYRYNNQMAGLKDMRDPVD
jgi:hypothetical protein